MNGAGLCLAGLLAWTGIAASESPAIHYYDVHGDTLADAVQWMDLHGPSGADGRRFHGYTEWRLVWRYRYRPDRSGCAVDSVETELDVTMQLPRWHMPHDAPGAAVHEWERYSAALRAHEDGHAGIGAAAADALKRQLEALRSTTCPALVAEVERVGTAILEQYRARELEYDASTGHGATQGARLQVDFTDTR